jgi:hypothetical protein
MFRLKQFFLKKSNKQQHLEIILHINYTKN